jgi:hypothetical protein
MASTSKVLADKQAIPSAAAAIMYTSPIGGKGSYIDSADFVNYLSGTPTVTTWIVPDAGSTSAVNQQSIKKAVPHEHTVSLTELAGRFISAGSSIYMQCTAATSVSLYITGRELT